ncbi:MULTISPECIES: hypothetical protein [Variovorax]|uniref:hypothetical protein n=1 Tax=Variovorax TaxID=34072 RepID=UPI0010F9BD9D|nr:MULTISPECIES: hypothetical protein [Variovorax]MBN8756295.1 hypothetical protein [Variovorax sp.]UKI10395.1 hypothetical protein L3V85_11280 [Variovorax paradoxus]
MNNSDPRARCLARGGDRATGLRVRRLFAMAAFGTCCAASLVGCATFMEDASAFREGWRTAEVVEVASARELRGGGRTDCRETASAQQIATSRFARLSYRSGGSKHSHVVVVGDGPHVAVGDVVFTNVIRCGTPLQVRSGSAADATKTGSSNGPDPLPISHL